MSQLAYKLGASSHLFTQEENENSTPAQIKFLQLTNKQALSHTMQLSSELEHSDLVSGIYEGGLKVWECSFDLVDYIKLNAP